MVHTRIQWLQSSLGRVECSHLQQQRRADQRGRRSESQRHGVNHIVGVRQHHGAHRGPRFRGSIAIANVTLSAAVVVVAVDVTAKTAAALA